MRHGMANRKLGRTSSHRKAMFRNQIASMIDRERIITTLVKAKEVKPLVEKMVTLGREDSVHARRQATKTIVDQGLVQKLFGTIGPRFADTPGGYTRIVKLGPRRGDGAEMAILEFTDYKLADASPAPAVKAKSKKAAPAAAEPAAEEEPKKKPAAKKAAPKKAAASEAKAGAEEGRRLRSEGRRRREAEKEARREKEED
jgi:large subunit ribosomal protein L17